MRPPVVLPTHDRPLPGPVELDRLMACRYAVMFVAGRSGSGLIQAHLDGHRQIAQIPAIWKFHDFLCAGGARAQASPAAFAHAFADFPAHAPLFDTRRSVHLAGQLGAAGEAAVVVDRGAFAAALVSCLGGTVGGPRRALYAAVLAYEWCLGRDLGAARVVFHHLHHGDWLWPELLIDAYNLGGCAPPPALRQALRPDLILIPLRDPRAILRSYPALAAAVTGDGAARVAYFDLLLRLLAQDWLRARVAAAGDIATAGLCLEDLKADGGATLAALCDFLGVDAGDPALAEATYYGHPWREDGWTTARNALLAARPELDRASCWQDEAFVTATTGALAAEVYGAPGAAAEPDDLLRQLLRAAEDPPATLFAGTEAPEGDRRAAAELAWNRVGFAERLRALAATCRLGSLALCRPRVAPARRLTA